jgi:hypothetical protein
MASIETDREREREREQKGRASDGSERARKGERVESEKRGANERERERSNGERAWKSKVKKSRCVIAKKRGGMLKRAPFLCGDPVGRSGRLVLILTVLVKSKHAF